ncbi:MAG: hypothetical protein ABW065_07920 [Solirubrobacterales bacterium]
MREEIAAADGGEERSGLAWAFLADLEAPQKCENPLDKRVSVL